MFSRILLFILFIFAFNKKVVLWQRSADISVLKNCTVTIYLDDSQTEPTIGLSLTVLDNVTLIDEEIKGELVVDDDTLLELISLIPVLAPFKPIIDALILIHGFIPGEVFQIKIEIENFNYTKTEVSGDVWLEANIMCWKGKCIWTGKYDFGHFDIPIKNVAQFFLKLQEILKKKE